MNYLKQLLFLLLLTIGINLSAQENDIDSLFEDAEDIEVSEEPENDSDDQNRFLNNLIKSDKFRLGANFDAFLGYSPGWILDTDPLFKDSGLLGLSTKMTLDAQIGDHFRFLQSYTVAFPGFEIEVSEFFADFDLGDLVYFRIGRQNLTWGISRYYTFTNLPARLPDDFNGDNDSYAIKLDIPIGIGGFQGLMYTRNGYMADSKYPELDEMGWGGYYNLALKQADITIGGFYHKEMNLRGFASLSTTLFDKLELYSEFVISYDYNDDDLLGDLQVEDPDQLDFGVNLGFLVSFFSGNLEFSGEYYYNGEETELEPIGSKLGLPLIWGHNLAAGFAVDFFDNKLKIETYGLYNISENTGVVAPIISFETLDFLKLTLAIPIVFGSDTGTYVQNNPDVLGRNISFVITAKISGKI